MIEGPNDEQDRKNVPKPNARIYAYTKGDVEVRGSKVVTCQFPVVNKLARVLFDFGATHSFISTIFADCLGRNKDNIRQTFRMALPSDDVMLSNYWLHVMLVVISKRELSVDLVILDMIDYDVMLGMDFLSKYEAIIDCKARVISFKPPREEKFVFVGDGCSSQKMFV